MINDKERGAHEHTDAYLDTYSMCSEARVEFGLNRARMTKLLASGQLPYEGDIVDKRIKWVKRRDVLEITSSSGIYLRRQLQQQPPPVRCSTHAPSPNAAATPPTTAIAATTATKVKERRPPGKLYASDKVVLDFLIRLCAATGKDYTPPVGIHTIAERCDLSSRTIQACGDRLVAANRIERSGYDVGNPDRTKRGMVYRILALGQSTLKP